MTRYRPTIAIALDASERRMVERLCDEGRLPHLERLRRRGRYAVLRSETRYFRSAVWPTVYSSRATGHHGWCYAKAWRADRMRFEYRDESWLDPRPFWNHLPEGARAALFDVPFVTRPPVGLDGVFVSGWQTHDQVGHVAAPSTVWREIERRFGPPALRAEWFGEQTADSLRRIAREALASCEQTGRIGRWLLESQQPDLFMLVLGALHRAGHYLWNLSQIDVSALENRERRQLEGALVDLYVAADRAVGEILASAPDDAHVLVFALHGMGENDGWAIRTRGMVDAVRRGRSAGSEPVPEGLLFRARQRIPWRLARQLTRRVPLGVNRRLLPLWSANMYDWSRTRFFALPCDVNGFVRINLRGREAEGIVEPGAEYEAVLDEVAAGLAGFRAIETGEPIVAEVIRTDELEVGRGPGRPLLPDLIVQWADVRSGSVSGVRSPEYGEVRWEPGPLPSGRSGNHRAEGWAIAAGPCVERGDPIVCDSIDILPTLYRWLGAEPDPGFHGQPISALGG